MDISIQKVPARVQRMSKRRQKKTLARLPKTIFTNCYPVSVDGVEKTGVMMSTFSFRYTF